MSIMRFSKILILFLVLIWHSVIAQESKILITRVACVDIPKILDEVNHSSAYQKFLLGLEENFQVKATEIENRIQELQNYLATETSLSDSEINEIKKEIEFQRENLNSQFSGSSSKDELILRGIYRLIKTHAEKEGYALIVEKSSTVIYNKAEVDITSAILEKMNLNSNSDDTESE